MKMSFQLHKKPPPMERPHLLARWEASFSSAVQNCIFIFQVLENVKGKGGSVVGQFEKLTVNSFAAKANIWHIFKIKEMI